MGTPPPHPNLSNTRLGLLHQTPGSIHGAQESIGVDLTPVAGPSSATLCDTPVARLRALLAHPSSSLSRRYPLTRPGRNNSGMSEMHVAPVLDHAREQYKGKLKSLGDDEPISPLSSLLRESGSIQIRSLVSTSAASFHSVPDSLLKSSGSEGEQQTMPPPVTHGTPPLTSSASQDGSPEVETHEANVIPVRVDEASFAHLNYTAMTTPEPPGAWTITPDPPLKHAPRATSPLLVSASELTPITSSLSSSWTPPSLSRANSGPERRSKPETPAGNDLFTPKHPQALLCTKPLHVRTSAPRGAWMSTTTQNWSNKQSKFGSIRTKKNILKVRFDVAESEASTTEVEHQVSPITDMPTSTPDSLFNSHASRSGNVTQTRINGFSQDDVVDNPVLARPVTSRRPMTPTSHANIPSSRPQRKAFIVKVVDAFGRERIDELLIPIANGRADVRDTICASPSAKSFTPRVSSKNKIRIIDATGEVQEDVSECSSVLHDNPPICRTAALVQIRKKLREWVSGLSDEDRPPDNLALNPSYSKEVEERSRAARRSRSRNQLTRTLRIESMKECKRNLMQKYTKEVEDRSGLLPTITGEDGSFRRDLVWVGVLLQIVFVLTMWRFAHIQARHLFCAVYYDPLYYPNLNPRAWERWAERPNAETWPPI